jgi:hypothetical protein
MRRSGLPPREAKGRALWGSVPRGIQSYKGNVGRLAGDPLRKHGQIRLVSVLHRGDNSGRLHLLNRARRAGPVGVDDGKESGLVQRRNEGGPLGIGHKQDRARLGHRKL